MLSLSGKERGQGMEFSSTTSLDSIREGLERVIQWESVCLESSSEEPKLWLSGRALSRIAHCFWEHDSVACWAWMRPEVQLPVNKYTFKKENQA